MATIRKRGKNWQIDYLEPNGKRIRRSFKKKKDAEGELAKRVSLMAEGRYQYVKRECRTTFKALMDKYRENFKHQPSWKPAKNTWCPIYGNILERKPSLKISAIWTLKPTGTP